MINTIKMKTKIKFTIKLLLFIITVMIIQISETSYSNDKLNKIENKNDDEIMFLTYIEFTALDRGQQFYYLDQLANIFASQSNSFWSQLFEKSVNKYKLMLELTNLLETKAHSDVDLKHHEKNYKDLEIALIKNKPLNPEMLKKLENYVLVLNNDLKNKNFKTKREYDQTTTNLKFLQNIWGTYKQKNCSTVKSCFEYRGIFFEETFSPEVSVNLVSKLDKIFFSSTEEPNKTTFQSLIEELSKEASLKYKIEKKEVIYDNLADYINSDKSEANSNESGAEKSSQDFKVVEMKNNSSTNFKDKFSDIRCLYAGYFIKNSEKCKPVTEDYVNGTKVTCGSGQALCNPRIFGFKCSNCDTCENNFQLKIFAKPIQGICVPTSKTASKDCNMKKNTCVTLTYLQQNKKIFDDFFGTLKEYCSYSKINFNNMNSQGRNSENTHQQDILLTCSTLLKQVNSLTRQFRSSEIQNRKERSINKGNNQ